MPDNALAPVRQFEIGMPGEERRELRLDRCWTSRFAPHAEFRSEDRQSHLADGEGHSILVHGVTLFGRLG